MTKILRITVLIFTTILATAVSSAQEEKKTTQRNINPSKSMLNWAARSAVGAHRGTLKFIEGHITLENDALTGGSFVVDMTTIDVPNLEIGKAKLEAHLNSADFFDTENYPKAYLVMQEITKTGTTYRVLADLTIKNITKSVVFDLNVMDKYAVTTLEVDRTNFGITYGSNRFFEKLGDKAIADKFMLTAVLNFQP